MPIDCTFYELFRARTPEDIRAYVGAIPDIRDYIDIHGDHIFVFAILKKDIILLQYLLAHCDPNLEINSLKETPLICAIKQHGAMEMFEIIVRDPRVELLKVDYSGWNALHHAINRNKIKQASILITKLSAADICRQTGSGFVAGLETPLHIAAMGGHCHLAIELLHKAPALLEMCDQNEQTPIHEVIKNGKIGMLKLLLIKGADPTKRSHGKDCYMIAREAIVQFETRNRNYALLSGAKAILAELELYRINPDAYRQQDLSDIREPHYAVSTAKVTCCLM